MLRYSLTIKIGDETDNVHDIYEHINEAHKETPLSPIVLNEDSVKELIFSFLTGDKTKNILLLVYDKNKKLVGTIAGTAINSNPFLNYTVAKEMVWYVKPVRGVVRIYVWLKLLEAFELWAEKVGCKDVYINSYSLGKVGKLFENRNYKLIEQTYKKEVTNYGH